MRGDIDGDGKITENDRNRISEHLGGTITLTGADSWCAKVTGNNEISVSDLVQLVQYLEGKTNNLTGIPTFADYYNNWTYHKVDDLTGYWTAEVVINGLKTTSDAIVNISNDEGIFYKSELSDGAISFYATRPPIAEVPATITFKPGTGVITTSYGYARVSSRDQNLDRQIIALTDAGVDRDNIFVDKQSGKDFNRPAYQDLVSTVQPNDMIIIKSIDRLGRNYSEILEQWSLITKSKKVDIKVLDMPLLDTSYCKDVMGTFISDLVLQVLSFQAEQERTYIKQRQAEGIAAAKSNGVQFGRPRKPLPSNFEELYQRFRKNEPITRLAKECPEISESTLRLRLQERFDLDRKR